MTQWGMWYLEEEAENPTSCLLTTEETATDGACSYVSNSYHCRKLGTWGCVHHAFSLFFMGSLCKDKTGVGVSESNNTHLKLPMVWFSEGLLLFQSQSHSIGWTFKTTVYGGPGTWTALTLCVLPTTVGLLATIGQPEEDGDEKKQVCRGWGGRVEKAGILVASVQRW